MSAPPINYVKYYFDFAYCSNCTCGTIIMISPTSIIRTSRLSNTYPWANQLHVRNNINDKVVTGSKIYNYYYYE